MVQARGSLPSTCETQMEFLAPESGLTLVIVAIWAVNQRVEGLSLSVTLLFKQIYHFLLFYNP